MTNAMKMRTELQCLPRPIAEVPDEARLRRMRKALLTGGCSGFTLVEIMMVVLTIALLASIAIPAFRKARQQTLMTRVANDLKVFSAAFDLYAMERRGYPPDCGLTGTYHLPNAEMEQYLDPKKWVEETAIGGYYEWEGRDAYPYAGIAIVGSTASAEQLRDLDKICDDGNLNTGHFRLITANNRYTYILDE
jgi:prepilin-type N-terminal cleavage/methylation domain-containing protein